MTNSFDLKCSFTKLLLITATFGFMFAINRDQGRVGVFLSVATGSAFALLIILAQKRHLGVITRTYLFSFGGALLGAILLPSAVNNRIDEWLLAIVGCLVGWIVGCLYRVISTKSHFESDTEPEQPELPPEQMKS